MTHMPQTIQLEVEVPGDLARFRLADLGALAAAAAESGGAHGAIHLLDGVLRTGGNAIAAMAAPLLEIQQLGLQPLTFGIMAPPAGERTTFEEDGGADSGSILRGKPHDIEDHGGGFGSVFGLMQR